MSAASSTQSLSPLDHAVLPANFFRNPFSDSLISTIDQDTDKPIFQHFTGPLISSHNSFNRLVKPGASVKVLAKRDYAFAHEAGVYSKQRNEVWFTSNLLSRNGTRRVEISRISLDTGDVSAVEAEGVDRGNGACSYNGGILFCEQGSRDTPSQLVWCDPDEPSTSRVILNNFNGRPFNSLNDVIVLEHPAGDLIFFTDPPYGFEQHFRPRPQLPPAVYAFDPREGHVRMVLDGLAHPNGIAFSPDGTVCYVTDTSHIRGCGRLDPSLQSTIYAFDVFRPIEAPGIPSLRNRRLFAFADCGVPDGIKCDVEGNVYAGCGDGIHVWNPHGLLIGRIVLGMADNNMGAGCANFCFVPGGMVCFSEDRIYHINGLAFEGASIVALR